MELCPFQALTIISFQIVDNIIIIAKWFEKQSLTFLLELSLRIKILGNRFIVCSKMKI